VQELAALSAQGKTSESEPKKERTELSVPKQFLHGRLLANGPKPIDTSFVVLETVSYDPSAAYFATSNKLFNQSVLEGYKVKDGMGKIPEFPNTGITTKPTYYAGVPDKGGLIRVPVWESPEPAKAFKYTQWQKFVYADIENDFINYKIDKIGADYLNAHQDAGTPASRQFIEGDYVLLVAMHVTTKEFKNWTWQTFFWSPDPSNPPSPSSKFEAGLRPKQLKGAAAHYAVSTAWAMVWPNQPETGGTDENTRAIIAFNPYLEGGFGPQVFSLPNKYNSTYVYGMQTNCMSCHSLSTLSGKNGYTTAQYIDMRDTSLFKNDVRLDFTWSIQGNINKDK